MNDKPPKQENEKPVPRKTGPPPKKDVKELLKTAKRRGYSAKGQQGLIEFDYPEKKE